MASIAFFLTTGDQAPLSSVSEVYDLPTQRREFFVKHLSDLYEKQKQQAEEASRRK